MQCNHPSSWAIKELIDCTSDNMISYGVVQPGEPCIDGIPLLRVNNISTNRFKLDEILKIRPDIEEKYLRTRLAGGEVLLTLVGTTGISAVVPKSMAGWNIARAIAAIRPNSEIGAVWINLCLQTAQTKAFLNARANTTVQKTLNLTDVKKIPISIPPKRIREKIELIITTIDDKIELNRKMNQTLEEMAQAIFKSWFVDFDPFKEGEFVESELGMIPKGWEVKSLTECTKVIGGGTPKTSIPEYWNGDIPWFSVVDTPSGSDVFVVETEKNITQEGLKNSSTKLLEAGTTIVTARGTVGKIALAGISMTMNQSCYALAPIDETPYFTYYLVSSSIVELKQKTHGSVFDTITRETLSSIQVVMPSIDAIRGFESTVESMMLKIKENLLETKTLSTLRDVLLPKLLSGEVEV